MSRSACERRQELAKYNGINKYRAQYSDTCGNCRQGKKGAKMIVEEIETITVIENETTRVCRNCKNELPMDAFTKNKECINGREWTCRRCRAERKKLTKASRQPVVKISTKKDHTALPPVVLNGLLTDGPRIPSDGYSEYKEKLAKKRMGATIEPPRLPVGLPPGVSIISTPDITDDDMSIDIDFTRYPDLLVSVRDAAKREFRTPAMQILFMLSKHVD